MVFWSLSIAAQISLLAEDQRGTLLLSFTLTDARGQEVLHQHMALDKSEL